MLSKQEMVILVENTKKVEDGKHFNSLLGERKAGSKWGGEWTEQAFLVDWDEITEKLDPKVKMPGCRYYDRNIMCEFPDASCGALSLRLFIRKGLMNMIKCVDGTHGKELQVSKQDLEAILGEPATGPSYKASLVVGPEAGVDVIYTVYPGDVLAPLPKDFDGDLSKLSTSTAVKLV